MAQKHTKGSSQPSLWAPGAVGLDDIMGQCRDMERETQSLGGAVCRTALPPEKELTGSLGAGKLPPSAGPLLLGLAASMDCLSLRAGPQMDRSLLGV